MTVFLRRARNCRGARAPWLVVLLLVLGGCAVSAPSAEDFEQEAAQALDDVASEVATVGIALEQHRGDRLFTRTTVVVLADSEEAGEKALQDFTALQPPTGLEATYEQVDALLQDAVGLLSDARIAVLAGDHQTALALSEELDKTRSDLSEKSDQLA